MSEQVEMPDEATRPRGAGPQLRLAREQQGLTIEQVAAQTRISQRHIALIEAGQFNQLPGRTYALGFARNIAKVVGLDQDDIAAMVRAEMNVHDPREDVGQAFEPGDPAHAPSRGLVWFSLLAGVLLLIGLFFAARILFAPAAQLPSLLQNQQTTRQAAASVAAKPPPAVASAVQQPAPSPTGPVVFTATAGPVWVRFYDADGTVLKEEQMSAGQSYTIPASAKDPMLWTGRPDKLDITIGGHEVPRLATKMVTMKGVPVDAASLLARGQPPTASLPKTAPAHASTVAPVAAKTPQAVKKPTHAPARKAKPAASAAPVAAPTAAPSPTSSATPGSSASSTPAVTQQ